MPMTSPCELSSGPPELPGFTEASVWMASSMRLPEGRQDGADGGDHAAGHGAGEAKRVADGVDLLADEEVGGVGEGCGLEVLWRR